MAEKISLLTSLFANNQINAYLVPSTDEFNNEYVPPHLRRLEWLTGFSGSNGIALIMEDSSGFFTDGRYLLQAGMELPKTFSVYELSSENIRLFQEQIGKKIALGYDPRLFTPKSLKPFEQQPNISSVAIKENLVDLIWHNKPLLPELEIITMSPELTGLNTKEKLDLITRSMPDEADYLFITGLDSICWLLNIRGHDIPYTPLILARALLDKQGSCELFIRSPNKATGIEEVSIRDIDSLPLRVGEIVRGGKKIAVSEASLSLDMLNFIPEKQRINIADPIQLPKACKNAPELAGMKDCHIQDGIALCKFLHWIEQGVLEKDIDEYEAAMQLLEFRKQGRTFVYPSFQAISAFAENGAIIHYSPNSQSAKKLTKEGLYLIDSGGQYLNGTTDVTRTTVFGIPTAEHVLHYTLVLKGHIALVRLKFPIGTTGNQIDMAARQYLWEYGLDYGHGTGHGVGHFLAVHEGPQRISKAPNNIALKPGMVVSNEPGVYLPGKYGIRLENMIYVKPSVIDGFLEFDNLTFVPFEPTLIDFALLSKQEKEWLALYHQRIYEALSSFLSDKEKEWLSQKTEAFRQV